MLQPASADTEEKTELVYKNRGAISVTARSMFLGPNLVSVANRGNVNDAQCDLWYELKLGTILNQIQNTHTVADLGCGFSPFLAELNAVTGCAIVGFDRDPHDTDHMTETMRVYRNSMGGLTDARMTFAINLDHVENAYTSGWRIGGVDFGGTDLIKPYYGTCDFAFSSWVVQYLTAKQFSKFRGELASLLKPGGIARICVGRNDGHYAHYPAEREWERDSLKLINSSTKKIRGRQSIVYAEVQKKNSSNCSCCFLTSACVRARGLSDDCDELTVLRRFRDEQLRGTPAGDRLIAEYYAIAPDIVAEIDRRADGHAIYEDVYAAVVACQEAILAGRPTLATERYATMVRGLQSRLEVGRPESSPAPEQPAPEQPAPEQPAPEQPDPDQA